MSAIERFAHGLVFVAICCAISGVLCLGIAQGGILLSRVFSIPYRYATGGLVLAGLVIFFSWFIGLLFD